MPAARLAPRLGLGREECARPTTPATRSPTRLIPARRAAAGKLLRSWGDGVLDTPHAVRIKQPMHAGDKVEIWITDMGADPGQGHVVKAFTPTGDLLATIGRVGNNGTGLDPLQFGNVVSPTCRPALRLAAVAVPHRARIRCRRIWTGPATRARWLSSTAMAARTTAPCASPPPLA